MADRFANGDTANDQRRADGRARRHGLRPDAQGLVPRRRPQGDGVQARLHQGPGHDRDLADAELQEQAGPGPRARRTRRPATTATGSPTSPRSTRTWAPTRTCATLIAAAHRRGMKVFFDIITNHTADVIDYAEAPLRLRLRRRPRPYKDAARQRLRRPRLRGQGHVPARSTPRRRSPTSPVLAPGRRARQGPGLAQRRHALPQPREHDVLRRELDLRRLRRPRRPVHREPQGRQRHGGDLRHVDPRLRRRRLPDRHDEARQPRVLAAVPAAHPADRALGREVEVLRVRRGLRHRPPTRSCRATRPRGAARPCSTSLPAAGARVRRLAPDRPAARRCSRRTTGSPTRTPTPTSCPRSWATTTWATSGCSCATTTRARRSPSCSRATSSPTR